MSCTLDREWSACGSERFARLTYAQADMAANQVANALLTEGL